MVSILPDRDTSAADATDRAAAGLRRLTDLLLRLDPDAPELGDVVDELERIETWLAEQRVDDADAAYAVYSAGGVDPVCGPGNALAPPLTLGESSRGPVTAHGILGLAYQGPRGLVHGGVSALMLEHLLELAAARDGRVRAPEILTVSYHRRLPLFEELVVSGGATERDGSRVRTRGEITVAGQTAVSAEAIFPLEDVQGRSLDLE